MRTECQEVETGLSLLRRVVQGRLDIVGLELTRRAEGGDPSTSRKSPGQTEYDAITLERGVTHDPEFEAWTNKVWNYGSGLGAEVSLTALEFRLHELGPAVREPQSGLAPEGVAEDERGRATTEEEVNAEAQRNRDAENFSSASLR